MAKPIQNCPWVSSTACAGQLNARLGLKSLKAARITAATAVIITPHITVVRRAMLSTRRQSSRTARAQKARPTRSPWPLVIPGQR